MKKLNIYWLRRDFRLTDNPALHASLKKSKEKDSYFLPIFVLEDYMRIADPKYQFGYPSRYFLSKALPEFSKNFKSFFIIKGRGAQSIIDICKKTNKDFEVEIFVNEDVYLDFHKQIKKITKNNIKINIFKDQMTVDANTKTLTGNYYSIFTPFKKAVWESFLKTKEIPKVKESDLASLNYFNLSKVDKMKEKILKNNFESLLKEFSENRKLKIPNSKEIIDIDSLLDFKPDFENLDNFYFTEIEAIKRFDKYLKKDIVSYKDERDFLDKDKTSKMSLGLTFGLVSSRTLKSKIQKHFSEDFILSATSDSNVGIVAFLSELIWREFYKYLFFHNPNLMNQEFQEKFRNKIKWIDDKEAKNRFTSWIKGETGYKVVDAAMIELAKTGFMHNRARMIVSSVLTKNLGVDWRWGQEYFRAMLVDLDESSNNGGWQWGASVGADPKPIRIFNPYLQAENYDPKNIFQKKWLGENFDKDIKPIVEHKEARQSALERYGLANDKNTPFRDY